MPCNLPSRAQPGNRVPLRVRLRLRFVALLVRQYRLRRQTEKALRLSDHRQHLLEMRVDSLSAYTRALAAECMRNPSDVEALLQQIGSEVRHG